MMKTVKGIKSRNCFKLVSMINEFFKSNREEVFHMLPVLIKRSRTKSSVAIDVHPGRLL